MCEKPARKPSALRTSRPSARPAASDGASGSRSVTVCGLIHSTVRPISGLGRYQATLW